MKEQETKLEIFRSHLLDRIHKDRISSITYDSEGRRYFQAIPKIGEYSWVFDLALREGMMANTGPYTTAITITEEKTDD